MLKFAVKFSPDRLKKEMKMANKVPNPDTILAGFIHWY